MKNTGRGILYILLVITGVLTGIIVGQERARLSYLKNAGGVRIPENDSGNVSGAGAQNADASRDIGRSCGNAIVTATEKVTPCVVGIVITQIQVVSQSYYSGDFFDLFFGPRLVPRYREVENMGSGVIIDSKGIILTNNHVVDGAEKLYVNFPDGHQAEGFIVGRDPYSDLAVVKVKEAGLESAIFGNSDKLMIGEWAIAIGNPFLNFFNDPRPTVTVGVISALNRNFAPGDDVYYQRMIQTDAAINPGNSGGPLVNAEGEVIGINTFIYTGSKQSKGSIGIGFAIPSVRVQRVVKELLEYGRRRQVWTGITVQDMDRAIALTLGISSTDGVLVTDVVKGSPGHNAGLRNGDVILAMGDRSIHSHEDLEGFFLDYFAGDTVSMRYSRGSREIKGNLILKEISGR
jgi:serine protease Do